MTQAVGEKTGAGAVRALRLTLNSAQFQQKYGNGKPVVVAELDDTEADPLAAEEADLLKRLDQLRARREREC